MKNFSEGSDKFKGDYLPKMTKKGWRFERSISKMLFLKGKGRET